MEYIMTNIGLVDALKERIESIVREFSLSCNVEGKQKAPQVATQYLPEKKRKEEQDVPDFPHVIVRFIEEKSQNGQDVVEVHIIAGTYGYDPQTCWKDVMNVLNRIKLELRKQPLIGPFELIQDSYRTVLPEEQPFPEWIAYSVAQFIVPRIQNEGGIPYVY
ncbi:hypothetical protein NP92_02850 [Anoxybacillus gonensis]|uniref:Phage protein n=1 Tax=Anoxybacillus gonensis TaxID=198467 RepID=A0AAW7TBV7_9BACL|nr:hypothetical protein [Anoxybacillus gonensis]AKS37415.1 hypothetical protein AFK25_02420 [Anoxybacillus gonensis]KGP61353.1 hypothetical protein NP92_02850 [Anoxybacillus gonensis]MDO0876779.1 hypothetical protein [Anoxybacillus gonensis]THD15370.1 hypothetical protein CI793_13470 [Anoxybacillus ayderensis]